MPDFSEAAIRDVLAQVMHPEFKHNLAELNMIRGIEVGPASVTCTIALPFKNVPIKDDLARLIREAIHNQVGPQRDVDIKWVEMTQKERVAFTALAQDAQGQGQHLSEIAHVIAVMSGKGGVGKSSVASMLAVTLRRKGYRVGLLDADITGPSIPKMFGARERPQSAPLGIMPVITKTGIRLMSINLLLPNEDDAVIWRGPLISSAIKQFWGEVFWGDLDYLVVDLPPGTADASLTVMQAIPLSGVLLVTSPQGLAGMVVRKAAHMVLQMGAPLLGLIENMSYMVCPKCGTRIEVFGTSKAARTAQQIGLPLLGKIPLDPELANHCDAGEIEDYAAEPFEGIVDTLIQNVPHETIKEFSKA